MMAFVFYFITLDLFNVTLATETKFCGFPGIPYGARMDSKLEEWKIGENEYINHSRLIYQVGQTVQYDCYAKGKRFRFEGNDRRQCTENGKWEGELPQCDGLKDPIKESAVCLPVSNGTSVQLDFECPCSVKEIDIYFQNEHSINSLNNVVLQIESSGRTGQCHRNVSQPAKAISNYAKFDCTLSNVPVVSELLIKFLHLEMELHICETEVYVKQKNECGYPEVPANGRVSMPSGRRSVAYQCLPGYELIGSAERKCENGKWTGNTPYCKPVGSSNGGKKNALFLAHTNEGVEADNAIAKDVNLNHRTETENLVPNEINDEEKDKMMDEFKKEISLFLKYIEVVVEEMKSAVFGNLRQVAILSVLLLILVVFVFLFVVKKDLGAKILMKMRFKSKKAQNTFTDQENERLNVTQDP